MKILHAWNFSCVHNFKFSLSCVRHIHFKSSFFPSKLILQRRPLSLTSNRSFSWEGFYSALSVSGPVLTLQNIVIDFHNFSGLPWWSVIMLTTLGIRSVFVFPFAVHQNQVINRLSNLNAELGKMAPELNKEVNIAAKMYGWNETEARRVFRKNMRQYYQKFVLRDNCHPFKIFVLILFQIPIWICFSVSLRNLTMFSSDIYQGTQSVQQQLKTEGTLWFKDLTVPDIFIPVLLAGVNLLLIEIHALRKMGESSIFQKALLYFMRLLVVFIAGAAVINPSSVSFYWLCSSSFGVVQSIILFFPKFRRILRIPQIANESSTPFRDIASNFKKRFS